MLSFIISYVELSKYNKHEPGKWKIFFSLKNKRSKVMLR